MTSGQCARITQQPHTRLPELDYRGLRQQRLCDHQGAIPSKVLEHTALFGNHKSAPGDLFPGFNPSKFLTHSIRIDGSTFTDRVDEHFTYAEQKLLWVFENDSFAGFDRSNDALAQLFQHSAAFDEGFLVHAEGRHCR